MDKYRKVQDKLAEIVAEIHRLGRWSAGDLDPQKIQNMGPFGMRTMTLEQWIQYFLVPRVEQIVKEGGSFPKSRIGPYAVKYFDGDDEGKDLLRLVLEFDAAVNE